MRHVIAKVLLCMAPVLNAGPVAAADTGNGGAIYAMNCQICHADDGQGLVADAPNFRHGDNLIKPDMELFNSISSGKGMMPAFRGMLSEQDILDVISYLRNIYQ